MNSSFFAILGALGLSVGLLTLGMAPPSQTAPGAVPADTGETAPEPIMLDDIHYYVLDRDGATDFFERHFNAREMAQPGRPLKFIDILQLHPQQSTINISPKGPFEGIAVSAPGRWEREVIEPSPDLPPMYGVHWLALSTPDLDATLDRLTANGVEVERSARTLPAEPDARAATIYGPAYTLITLVERPDAEYPASGVRIDHLQLLVGDVGANEEFYRDVFGGEVVRRHDGSTVLDIAGTRFVLSAPSAFEFSADEVVPRDPDTFRPGIDHIGFFYEDVRPAYQHAQKQGYEFALEPTRMNYFDEPTPYTFAITFSPDSLQCEMYQQDGRTGPRTDYADSDDE